jgi:hypothetical protein
VYSVQLLLPLQQVTHTADYIHKTSIPNHRKRIFFFVGTNMRTITSVTCALARRTYHPQQRLNMSYCCRISTRNISSYRAGLLQAQPLQQHPSQRSNMNNNNVIRTFSVKPTMIKYMPIQTIDVR